MVEIKGKVAEIVDKYSVVINRGHEHGVEEDLRFIIYEEGKDIIDPDTKESLGKYEYIKAKIKVVHVNDKFSTAISDEDETVITSPIAALLASSQWTHNERTMRKQLPLTKDEKEKFDEIEIRTVEIGDLVRLILD